MKKIILHLLLVSTSCLAQQTETKISTSPQTEIQAPQKTRDYDAEAKFYTYLPSRLKLLFTLICFLLIVQSSLKAILGAIFMAALSTALYYFPSFIAYAGMAFSGSFILATIFFLILGMVGFLIDLILAYILSKFVPIKRAYYVIWVLAFNMLSVVSFLAIFFSWSLFYH